MYLKVKCGSEIRKSTIDSEGISFTDLLQKVIQLFPSLRELEAPNVQLGYRDADNDVICFSTDEELQTAITQAEGDTLNLVVTSITETSTEDDDLLHGNFLSGLLGHGSYFHSPSLFDQSHLAPFHHFGSEPHHFGGGHHHFGGGHHLFGGGHHLFGRGHHHPNLFESPSNFRDRILQAREEELRQQRAYEEKMRQAHLERRKALLEKAKQMHEERAKEISENRRKSQDLQRQASKGGTSTQPAIPELPAGWIVRPIGSWDPVIHEGPGFHSTSHGPYGYYAYYGPEETETESKDEKKQESEEAPQQQSAEGVPEEA